ncbi:MAG: hypothetical protein QMD05_10085 [Candidatus Brocadiaceae bacterium]|nr:hypothetical protein [Candidatus Brocadiaceae bacterium]
MSLLSTRFEILSLPFELTTNDKKFFNEFIELNSALACPTNGISPVARFSVIKNTRYFCVRENGKLRRRWVHRWPLYLYAMMCVRESLYVHLKGHILLHSGAVVNGNKVLLLPGVSGSGKSTLTMGLVNCGFKYLTDEVTVINLSSLEAIPFQRPIYMYGWALPVSTEVKGNFRFYRFWERYGGVIEPWQYAVPQGEAILPKDSRFEVAWIIFPRYNGDKKGDSHLIPISKAEAVFSLMQRGWNTPGFRDWGLKVWSELVKSAECYRLEMGDLKEACELVKGVMGKVSSSVEDKVSDNIWKRKKLW